MPRASDLRSFRRHAEWALAAATAQELGVYDALAEGAATAGELARRLDLHPRGLGILLGVLEEMELVRMDGELVQLTGSARGHLVDPDTPDFVGDATRLWLHNIREWAHELPRAIRTGEPAEEEESTVTDREAMERFMAAMANKSPALVESVVDAALERAPGAQTALDLGGGPGTFSRELLERGLQVILFDRPEVVEYVEDAYGLAGLEGLELVGGDFLETLPGGPFDVVLLANITHIFDPGANADLIGRLAERISPGGTLAIMDFVRGQEDFAALFAITMLLNTERGNTYRLEEYRRWLEGAGLSDVRCTPVEEERQVVTAVKGR